MSSPDSHQAWQRLAAAARTVRDDRDASAPYGFATRVAALALAQERRVVSVLDRMALRALGVASLLALFSVALNYQEMTSAFTSTGTALHLAEDTDTIAPDDAVAIVLDLAD